MGPNAAGNVGEPTKATLPQLSGMSALLPKPAVAHLRENIPRVNPINHVEIQRVGQPNRGPTDAGELVLV